MTTLRLELVGRQADAHSLARVLRRVGGFTDVREFIDALWTQEPRATRRVPLSSEPRVHALEVEVADRRRAERVREIAGMAATLLDAEVRVFDEH